MSKITDELLSAARVVAPAIASFLPGGPLVGAAFTALSNAVLGKPDAKPEEITAAVATMTPDQIAAVRAKDQEFSAKMKELDLDADKLVFDDRASARTRESTVKDKTPRNLAYLVVGSFVAMVACELGGWGHVDSALAGTLIGYLSAKAEQVMSYYFGSSSSSDRKTELLAKAPAVKD